MPGGRSRDGSRREGGQMCGRLTRQTRLQMARTGWCHADDFIPCVSFCTFDLHGVHLMSEQCLRATKRSEGLTAPGRTNTTD